jgi:hypothetical protein
VRRVGYSHVRVDDWRVDDEEVPVSAGSFPHF